MESKQNSQGVILDTVLFRVSEPGERSAWPCCLRLAAWGAGVMAVPAHVLQHHCEGESHKLLRADHC